VWAHGGGGAELVGRGEEGELLDLVACCRHVRRRVDAADHQQTSVDHETLHAGPCKQLHFGDSRDVDAATPVRCKPNMAHTRQSMPDSGLEFRVLITFGDVPYSLGSGTKTQADLH